MRKSVVHDFRAHSSEIVKLVTFYVILCLRGAFRNVTPCINEKAQYCYGMRKSLLTTPLSRGTHWETGVLVGENLSPVTPALRVVS